MCVGGQGVQERLGLEPRLRVCGTESSDDRTESEFGCLADEVERTLSVVDAWQLDDDVLVLPCDVGFGDTDGVDSVPDDLDRLIEGVFLSRFCWFEHHCDAATKIETKYRSPAGGERAEHGNSGQYDSDYERCDV